MPRYPPSGLPQGGGLGWPRWPPGASPVRKAHATSCDKYLAALSPLPTTAPSSLPVEDNWKLRGFCRGTPACLPAESGPQHVCTGFLAGVSHTSPPPRRAPSPQPRSRPEASVLPGQHYRVSLGPGANQRMTPKYMKGTHLQRLADVMSLSEKRSEISSPFCTDDRSFAFIYNPQHSRLKAKTSGITQRNVRGHCCQHFVLLPLAWAVH